MVFISTETNDNDKRKSTHAYDDAFKTLRTDCPELLIPVINDIFHTSYSKGESLISLANEFFMSGYAKNPSLIITDSYIQIGSKKYHIECQSTTDGTMIIRMFEYDSQIAIDSAEIDGNRLTVKFPNSAVLYLRSNSNTPDKMEVQIETPGGSISYDVHMIKINKYNIDDLFNKELYVYIPFYIFTFEHSFGIIEKDKEKLESLKKQYSDIVHRLDEACEKGKLTEYQKSTILNMSCIVLDAIASKYNNIRNEVDAIMGGEVLDYPAKRILNQGRNEGLEIGRNEGLEIGRSEGLEIGRSEGLTEGVKAFILDNIEENIPKERIIEKLQKRFDMTEEEALEKYETYSGIIG